MLKVNGISVLELLLHRVRQTIILHMRSENSIITHIYDNNDRLEEVVTTIIIVLFHLAVKQRV